MTIKENVTEIQHLGLPTRDFKKTIEFYEGLGFHIRWKNPDRDCAFIRLGQVEIETYQRDTANQVWGAWDHVALMVKDVDEAWREAKEKGYRFAEGEDGPIRLPFEENGCRYFTIVGPNEEKIEFNQRY